MPDLALEARLRTAGYSAPAGVDEAGRGPLAGPLVVAAVILPEHWRSEVALDDSKKLSEPQRNVAFDVIRRSAVSWGVAVVAPEEIDRVNILQATLTGMCRAVAQLAPSADYALVDGNQVPVGMQVPVEAVVKGDQKSLSIAAASILAKVLRDRIMVAYHKHYPQWGFDGHKGYGTKAHLKMMRDQGPSPIHRLSFRPKSLQG